MTSTVPTAATRPAAAFSIVGAMQTGDAQTFVRLTVHPDGTCALAWDNDPGREDEATAALANLPALLARV